MDADINVLRYPLYMLHYIDDVYKEKVFAADFVEQIRGDYSKEVIQEIQKSLTWALQNPGYNYNSLMPNLRFSNEDIFHFLTRYAEIFKLV